MTLECISWTDTLQAIPQHTVTDANPRFPSGEVTLLFSDIEGSTRHLQRLGGDEYARVLSVHRRLLRTAIRAGNGREVDVTGDGCFAVFQHAPSAVAASVAAQHAFSMHQWPGGVPVRVRMGLHTGEPALFEEGYVGLDVHVAARICAAAQGGQILLSRSTRVLAEYELPAGVGLRYVGSRRLKDLDHPELLSEIQIGSRPCCRLSYESSLAA